MAGKTISDVRGLPDMVEKRAKDEKATALDERGSAPNGESSEKASLRRE